MTYLVLFLASTVLALVLRYWGEEILANVTSMASEAVPGFCSSDRCWGSQGAYRCGAGENGTRAERTAAPPRRAHHATLPPSGEVCTCAISIAAGAAAPSAPSTAQTDARLL
jgi:hypothetical protein